MCIRDRSKTDFEKDEKLKSVQLSETGIRKAELYFSVDNITEMQNIELFHCINKSLYAHKMLQVDKDYIVMDGEIVIVDELSLIHIFQSGSRICEESRML